MTLNQKLLDRIGRGARKPPGQTLKVPDKENISKLCVNDFSHEIVLHCNIRVVEGKI